MDQGARALLLLRCPRFRLPPIPAAPSLTVRRPVLHTYVCLSPVALSPSASSSNSLYIEHLDFDLYIYRYHLHFPVYIRSLPPLITKPNVRTPLTCPFEKEPICPTSCAVTTTLTLYSDTYINERLISAHFIAHSTPPILWWLQAPSATDLLQSNFPQISVVSAYTV